MPTAILSDQRPIEVRTLGIFELDSVPRPSNRPFTYKMRMVTGEEVEVELDLDAFDEPPRKPDKPEHEIESGSPDWWDLRTWQTYQAAESYEKKKGDDFVRYLDAVPLLILSECIAREDVRRIVTEEDWKKVYTLALVPQLSKEILANTLRDTYSASYADEEIFVALEETGGGKSMINAIRLWENQVMLEMSMTEVEYATLPLEERARKVCAHMWDRWIEHLEISRIRSTRSNNGNGQTD